LGALLGVVVGPDPGDEDIVDLVLAGAADDLVVRLDRGEVGVPG
jgi:hypothetical protein